MAKVNRTYYKSGELESEVFMINDKIHGEYKSYWKNGQLKEIYLFIDRIEFCG